MWKTVAYVSRAMMETERHYAQIEKEALATTWACYKFVPYILGKKVHVEIDHKPLVPLLSAKHLDNMPTRILQFRLRLARYMCITIPFRLSQGNTSTRWILFREHPSPHKWIRMPTMPQLKKQIEHSWKCVFCIFLPALIESMSIVPHRLLTRHAQQ